MSRGDRRENIFNDVTDREDFLRLLGRVCAKTGWEVHAYCLMSNHWHAVIETPQANLARGMRWLLGTYTESFNRLSSVRSGSSGAIRRGRGVARRPCLEQTATGASRRRKNKRARRKPIPAGARGTSRWGLTGPCPGRIAPVALARAAADGHQLEDVIHPRGQSLEKDRARVGTKSSGHTRHRVA